VHEKKKFNVYEECLAGRVEDGERLTKKHIRLNRFDAQQNIRQSQNQNEPIRESVPKTLVHKPAFIPFRKKEIIKDKHNGEHHSNHFLGEKGQQKRDDRQEIIP